MPSRTSARIFPSMLRIALHSPLQHINGSFAGQGAKSAASAPSDTGTLPNRHCICHFQQVLNPAQFSSQSDVQPCFKRRLFNCRISACLLYFCWCSGLRRAPVSGCPSAHDPLLAKSVQSFHGFDVFFRLGSLLESVNVSREIHNPASRSLIANAAIIPSLGCVLLFSVYKTIKFINIRRSGRVANVGSQPQVSQPHTWRASSACVRQVPHQFPWLSIQRFNQVSEVFVTAALLAVAVAV